MKQTVNQRVKIIRDRLNLSQATFAEKLNMTQGGIGDIERGRINVSKKVFRGIVNVFRVNEEWLASGIGEPFDIINEVTEPRVSYQKKTLVTPYDGDIDLFVELLNTKNELVNAKNEIIRSKEQVIDVQTTLLLIGAKDRSKEVTNIITNYSLRQKAAGAGTSDTH